MTVLFSLLPLRSDEKLELQWTLEGHQLGIVSVDVSPNGAIAASSSLDAHIRLWDLEFGKQIKSMDAGPGRTLSGGFSATICPARACVAGDNAIFIQEINVNSMN